MNSLQWQCCVSAGSVLPFDSQPSASKPINADYNSKCYSALLKYLQKLIHVLLYFAFMLNKTYVQLLFLLHACDFWSQDTVETNPYSRLHTVTPSKAANSLAWLLTKQTFSSDV